MPKAKEVMNPYVVAVSPDEDIYEAIRVMILNSVTGLPVTNEDRTVIGVITEKDVLSLLYDNRDKPGAVRDFMTTDVVCFDQEDDLDKVVESLRTKAFRRVPILNQGRLVGIISRRDVIRYIRDLRREDRALKDSLLELVF